MLRLGRFYQLVVQSEDGGLGVNLGEDSLIYVLHKASIRSLLLLSACGARGALRSVSFASARSRVQGALDDECCPGKGGGRGGGRELFCTFILGGEGVRW